MKVSYHFQRQIRVFYFQNIEINFVYHNEQGKNIVEDELYSSDKAQSKLNSTHLESWTKGGQRLRRLEKKMKVIDYKRRWLRTMRDIHKHVLYIIRARGFIVHLFIAELIIFSQKFSVFTFTRSLINERLLYNSSCTCEIQIKQYTDQKTFA